MNLKDSLIEILKHKRPRYITEHFLRSRGLFDLLLEETPFLSDSAGITQRIFHVIHGISRVPTCPHCGSIVKNAFHKFDVDPRHYLFKFCSVSCSRSYLPDMSVAPDPENEIKHIKLQETLKEAGYFKAKNDPLLVDAVKIELERRSIELPETFREAIHMIENNVEISPKCSCGAPVKFVSGKYRKHCSSRCSANDPETRKKSRQTVEERYGVENVFQAEETKAKIRETCLEKYGVEHHTQTPEARARTSKIMSKRSTVERVVRSRWVNTYDRILKRDGVIVPAFDANGFHGGGHDKKYPWRCTDCETTFQASYDDGIMPMCPTCNKGTQAEREIAEFLSSINVEFQARSRSVIPPLELDFYVPSKKIAIEHDGNYWHSEAAGTPRSYHLDKTKRCAAAGVRLVHVFEDEWLFRREIVEAKLASILGMRSGRKVNARDCEVREVSAREKDEFLIANHVQGRDRAKVKLGLFDGDDLVAVITFGRRRIALGSKSREGEWELSRYAARSDLNVRGGAGKLLTHFERNWEWTSILSYADLRWSIDGGSLYERLGFELDHVSPPNYWYVGPGDFRPRMHRFGFAKHRLPEVLGESFDSTKTERENMELAGYARIWDCGNLVYHKNK